jgi:hypothetical protein
MGIGDKTRITLREKQRFFGIVAYWAETLCVDIGVRCLNNVKVVVGRTCGEEE